MDKKVVGIRTYCNLIFVLVPGEIIVTLCNVPPALLCCRITHDFSNEFQYAVAKTVSENF